MGQARRGVCLTVLLLLTSGSAKAESPQPHHDDRRRLQLAVGRGLAAVEKAGVAWWRDRGCNSCHHGPYLVWAHEEARRHGFPVDEVKLAAWSKQAFEIGGGPDEYAHLMLARSATPREAPAEAVNKILMKQLADGSWKYRGQPIDRARSENTEVATLWMTLALSSVAPGTPRGAAAVKARERALAWLAAAPPGPGTEAVVLRLLSAHALEDRPRVKALLGELQKRQNPDGGWSWRAKGATKGAHKAASDPFGTGQVLHAVGMTAGAGADPTLGQATSRARTFLLNTQRPDGTWYSPSRKPGAPDNEIADYWGTTWAIIGLAATATSAP